MHRGILDVVKVWPFALIKALYPPVFCTHLCVQRYISSHMVRCADFVDFVYRRFATVNVASNLPVAVFEGDVEADKYVLTKYLDYK